MQILHQPCYHCIHFHVYIFIHIYMPTHTHTHTHTHTDRAAGQSEICKASGRAEHLGRVNGSLESKGWKPRLGFYTAVWRQNSVLRKCQSLFIRPSTKGPSILLRVISFT